MGDVPNNALYVAAAIETVITQKQLHQRVLKLLNRCHEEDQNLAENRCLYTKEIYHILLGKLH